MRIQGKKDEKVEVLSQAPVEEINMGHTTADELDAGPTARDAVNIAKTAPVIADARRLRDRPEVEAPKPHRFRVMNPNGKWVQDPHSIGRVHLHEGKEISSQHYDIRKLQQQGVRLIEIDDDGEPIAATG